MCRRNTGTSCLGVGRDCSGFTRRSFSTFPTYCVAELCKHVLLTCAKLICMRAPVRMLMLWILIVSLPLRGMAGAIISPCPMTHASLAAGGAVSMDHYDEFRMPMAQTQARENVSADGCNQAMACEHDSYQRHLSCRACFVCHLRVSAPAPMALTVPAIPHFTSHTISPDSSFPNWIPFRIERPPRI